MGQNLLLVAVRNMTIKETRLRYSSFAGAKALVHVESHDPSILHRNDDHSRHRHEGHQGQRDVDGKHESLRRGCNHP